MRFGNASFNIDYVKSLSLEEFKKEFTGKIVCKTHTMEQIYSEVTGFSSDKPKEKPFDPRENTQDDGPNEVKKKRWKSKDSEKEIVIEIEKSNDEIPSE